MPIKWTAELDSILLHGVFEECQISFNKTLCEKISERVRAAGETDCTAKAIENRLYSWKKKNASAAGAPPSTPSKTTGASNKSTATPKTKTPRAKKGAAKKKVESEEDDEDALKSPSAGRKRKSESKEGNESKKVKSEPLDAEEFDEVVGGGGGEEDGETAFV